MVGKHVLGDTPMSLNDMLSGRAPEPSDDQPHIINSVDEVNTNDHRRVSAGGDKSLIIDDVGYLGTSDLVYSPLNNRNLGKSGPKRLQTF